MEDTTHRSVDLGWKKTQTNPETKNPKPNEDNPKVSYELSCYWCQKMMCFVEGKLIQYA